MNKQKIQEFVKGLKANKDFHYETKQVFIELAEALLEEPKAVKTRDQLIDELAEGIHASYISGEAFLGLTKSKLRVFFSDPSNKLVFNIQASNE